MELRIRDLSKSYGEKRALSGFSCCFVPGIYAILGPNGAGKSTLMHLICDVTARQEGEILCDGRDILTLGASYRRRLGFMPQSQAMYEGMSAFAFLCYMAALKGLRPAEAREQIRRLLQVVNLSDAAGKKLGGFSGGMRQRVLLAQALLGDPELLILDEPTAGLDPEERVRLREYIACLGRDKIVLITTHITSDVETIADRVLLMRQGRLLCAAERTRFLALAEADDLETAYIRLLHRED